MLSSRPILCEVMVDPVIVEAIAQGPAGEPVELPVQLDIDAQLLRPRMFNLIHTHTDRDAYVAQGNAVMAGLIIPHLSGPVG